MINCHMIVCWTDMKFVQPSYLYKLRYFTIFKNNLNFIFINFLIFEKKTAIDFLISAISFGFTITNHLLASCMSKAAWMFLQHPSCKRMFPSLGKREHNGLSQKSRAHVSKVSLIWISNFLKVQLTWHRCLVVTQTGVPKLTSKF